MASDRSLVSTFAAVLVAGSLILGSGCSLAITAPDPQRPRDEVPKCDTGKGLVAADGLWGALFGATSIASFSDDSSGAGIAFAGLAALFVASAVRGSNAANSCREDFDVYNASVRDLQRQQLLAREAVQRQAAKPASPKPAVAPPVQLPPVQIDPAQTQEPPVQEPAPEYATPRPPAQRPITKPATKSPRPADPDVEDWSSFWKELP